MKSYFKMHLMIQRHRPSYLCMQPVNLIVKLVTHTTLYKSIHLWLSKCFWQWSAFNINVTAPHACHFLPALQPEIRQLYSQGSIISNTALRCTDSLQTPTSVPYKHIVHRTGLGKRLDTRGRAVSTSWQSVQLREGRGKFGELASVRGLYPRWIENPI